MTLKTRLRRVEARARMKTEGRDRRLIDAALRLLSDEDLLGLCGWMETPEGMASLTAAAGTGPEPPEHLWNAWQQALEKARVQIEPER